MKRILVSTLLALLAGLAAALPVEAQQGPPPWAPAHGWRAKHAYVYYPNSEVYYAPDTRTWFWPDGDTWASGVVLPLALQVYVRAGGVQLELGSAQPWVEHRYVVEHYGGRRVDWRGRGDEGANDQGYDRPDKHADKDAYKEERKRTKHGW